MHIVCGGRVDQDCVASITAVHIGSLSRSDDFLVCLSLLLAKAEAVLADQVDDEADDADDGSNLNKSDRNDPEDNPAHVAHITVSALAGLLAEALFAAAIAAFVIRAALSVDRRALIASLTILHALELVQISAAPRAGGAGLALRHALLTKYDTAQQGKDHLEENLTLFHLVNYY